MPEPLNWLQRTGEIPDAWQELLDRFGRDRIDAACAGRWYELAHATVVNALAMALDTTPLSTRKKKRYGPAMLDLLFQALPLVFMFGYAARCDEERAGKALTAGERPTRPPERPTDRGTVLS